MRIISLLEDYRKIRDSEVVDLGPHQINKSEPFPSGVIKTLDVNFDKPLSPMLRERFIFCSSWLNAYLSQDWLSLDEINKWDKNSRIVEWIDLRRENSYPGEPLEDLQPRDISIFAINPHEPEEIYLTWDGDSEEPRLWHYFGAEFYTFNSFERFLLYINKIIGDEKMPKILVVEDDEKIIRILKIQLEHQQFDITIENDGIEAMNNVDKNRDVYDLIILDLGLPGMSGNRLCKNIRKISETPIIVLSARNSVEEKVELLQNGASDYITKPFDMNELSARIQVNIRKQKKENLTYKDIDINVANYTAKISNEQISLSKTEFELLKILVEHSEEVVTRDQIIEKLWGWDASDNLLDSTMKKLRQKIPENYIKTMRGIGYILKYEDKN